MISNGGVRAGLTENGTRKAMPGGREVRAVHPCPGEVLTQRPTQRPCTLQAQLDSVSECVRGRGLRGHQDPLATTVNTW